MAVAQQQQQQQQQRQQQQQQQHDRVSYFCTAIIPLVLLFEIRSFLCVFGENVSHRKVACLNHALHASDS
jgi:hypothetical protein